MEHYQAVVERLFPEENKVRSSENVAALMAPADEKSLLMQKMEDSNLRQLWRLTRLFFFTKRAGQGPADTPESAL